MERRRHTHPSIFPLFTGVSKDFRLICVSLLVLVKHIVIYLIIWISIYHNVLHTDNVSRSINFCKCLYTKGLTTIKKAAHFVSRLCFFSHHLRFINYFQIFTLFLSNIQKNSIILYLCIIKNFQSFLPFIMFFV